jgi:Domain of unknown function (DUF4136)
MIFLKVGCCLFLLLAAAGTLKAQKVITDHDPNVDFSKYKTFMWIKPPHVRLDPLMDQRLVDDINAALAAKGWQLVTEGADVGIAAHMATRQRHTLETFYDGFGGGWGWHYWGGGLGIATTHVDTYTVGTLVVDMFDGRTKQLIWRGIATDTLSEKPDKDAEKIQKAVDKLFKTFPPK